MINLAISLANMKKVICIDLDRQVNLAMRFGYSNSDEIETRKIEGLLVALQAEAT